jgi:hypothetical protein
LAASVTSTGALKQRAISAIIAHDSSRFLENSTVFSEPPSNGRFSVRALAQRIKTGRFVRS